MQDFELAVAADLSRYERVRDLTKLIAVWPAELTDYSIEGTEHIIECIRKPMLATHRLGVTGHWSYDHSRHIALVAAFRMENARLARLRTAQEQERRSWEEAA